MALLNLFVVSWKDSQWVRLIIYKLLESKDVVNRSELLPSVHDNLLTYWYGRPAYHTLFVQSLSWFSLCLWVFSLFCYCPQLRSLLKSPFLDGTRFQMLEFVTTIRLLNEEVEWDTRWEFGRHASLLLTFNYPIRSISQQPGLALQCCWVYCFRDLTMWGYPLFKVSWWDSSVVQYI